MNHDEKKYNSILQLERLAAEQKPKLKRDLSDEIMQSISSESESMAFQLNKSIKYLVGSLIMSNVALVVALALIVSTQNSNNSKLASSEIKSYENFKAVSINISDETAAKLSHSNAYADVLLAGNNSKKLAVAKFLPVIVVKKNTGEQGSTAYHLTDSLTAKKISLATEDDSIFLSPLNTGKPTTESITPNLVSLRDPSGRIIAKKISATSTAVLYLSDPETGKEVRHTLKNGKWVKDEIFDVYSF